MTSFEAFMSDNGWTGPSEPRLFALVKGLHDEVVQSLTAASMVLGVRDLAYEDRRRAGEAVSASLARLEALLTEATDAIEPAFSQEAARTPPAAVLATIVRSAIAEALANIREHASPSEVTIIVQGDVDGVALDVLNDGSRAPSDNADDTKERNRSGVGLRLVDLQARSIGAQLEAGPVGNGEWRVRVRIPR